MLFDPSYIDTILHNTPKPNGQKVKRPINMLSIVLFSIYVWVLTVLDLGLW